MIILAVTAGCFSGNKSPEQSTSLGSDTAALVGTSAPDTMPAPVIPTGRIDSLRMGMQEAEVIAILGEPTKREAIGRDAKVKMEDWWYGENQKVRMVQGTVNHVVRDVAHQKELFRQLVEAKKNNDEAEVQRIMTELTKDHK